jgi:hypothetical protein
MIQPYDVYVLFTALKLHFNSQSYNAVTYSYKTPASTRLAFSKRKDQFYYAKLARKFLVKDELHNFILANVVYTKGKIWVGDLLSTEAENRYVLWRKRTEALRQTVRDDLRFVLEASPLSQTVYTDSSEDEDASKTINAAFEYVFEMTETYPRIIAYYLSDEVSLETIVVLEKMFGFTKNANKKIQEPIIWPKLYLTIQKYTSLLKFDMKSMKVNIINTISH